MYAKVQAEIPSSFGGVVRHTNKHTHRGPSAINNIDSTHLMLYIIAYIVSDIYSYHLACKKEDEM